MNNLQIQVFYHEQFGEIRTMMMADGQGRLFYWLRLHGYLFQRETRPIQKWVEEGLFDTNVTLLQTDHGKKERITTKVTGKGQQYFIEGFVSGRFKYKNGEL